MFHQYLSLSKEFLSIDCYVSIPRTHRSLFQSIVSSVSLALIGVSLNRLLRQYLSHSLESLSIDCYVSIPRTHRSLFQSTVTSVSLALTGVSFNRLLRQYLSHSLESLSIDCYVSIPRTHRSLSQSPVTSVSVSHSKEFLSIAGYQVVTSVSFGLSCILDIIVQAIFKVMKVFLELLST